MSKVLEFPSQRRQGLAYLDRQIREMLAARGADSELIDFAAATVKRVYERSTSAENYSFRVLVPDSIPAADAEALGESIRHGLETIRAENHAVVIRLIAELVMAEVRIFQAQRDP